MKWRNGLVLILVLVTAVVIAGCSSTEPVSEESSPPETAVEAVDDEAVEEMTEADVSEEAVVEEVAAEMTTEEKTDAVETPDTAATSETASATEEVKLGILTPDQVLERDKLVIDFALENLDGQVVQLSDYRGKLVLLNFWTTW